MKLLTSSSRNHDVIYHDHKITTPVLLHVVLKSFI